MIHLSKIICPTDYSEASHNAVVYATEFARRIGAHVRFLHVLHAGNIAAKTAAGYGVPISGTEHGDVVPESFSSLLMAEKKKGLDADILILRGDASTVIAEQSALWGADLIVMGSHGRSGLLRLMMGSVAEAVFRESSIPVLLVKQSAGGKVVTA
ncbi:universal stress protein [Chlorobium phaeovibrioides]|uniref:UspA domain protein n=1 Tax=Chlorobium phaeovibrioides (strain DSM 265 / 1930) TaxID=290318 RepID=A4SEX6_CHLPM|nr:universal stress protein [Chlorobium phaeovibrioides]QEQ56901.1 universal stress protein [Chlorobium phaeovibrioides]HCD36930.1 universal stress protein [Chlorobium sp.]